MSRDWLTTKKLEKSQFQLDLELALIMYFYFHLKTGLLYQILYLLEDHVLSYDALCRFLAILKSKEVIAPEDWPRPRWCDDDGILKKLQF